MALPPPTLIVGLLSERVPVVAPKLSTLAAPPIFKSSSSCIKREAAVVVVVRSALVAPLTARSPPITDDPSTVNVPLA